MKKTILLVLVLALGLATKVAKADFVFGKPQNLGPIINSSSSDYSACVSVDGLELYFCSERPGGFGAGDIWVSTRQSVNDPWGTPANLGSTVNSPYSDSYPSLSPDGLTLYFSDAYSGSPRSGGRGGGDIWMTTRPNRNDSWGVPVNVGAPINSSNLDISPTISGDDLTLIFTSNNRVGGMGSWDLWMSTRVSVQDPWGPLVNLGSAVNSGAWDGECGLSWDGRAVLYDSGRTGSFGAVDMFMSTRNTLADPWSVAVNLGPVINSSGNDGTPRVSADMKTLYFCSDRPGGYGSYDLFEAPITPVVDLNSDGIVDASDMCIIVDHWGTDNILCDIGPMPWGDGIVDVQDLIVLAEHLFEEVLPAGCVAYWKLDQKEGNIAYNSTGYNDGLCYGEPVWQPDSGQVAGALQFDGIDDYVETDFVLNPANGPFSALAWIKGGAPGQAIISQADTLTGRTIKPGSVWLGIDPLDGKLMTTLTDPQIATLLSESIITDGQWHNVGVVVVKTGSLFFRLLYLDGVMVAIDSQSIELLSSNGGLRIGAGKNLEAGNFFSGLIDDVRIYNKALDAEEIAALGR
jgi:hypothetical protein